MKSDICWRKCRVERCFLVCNGHVSTHITCYDNIRSSYALVVRGCDTFVTRGVKMAVTVEFGSRFNSKDMGSSHVTAHQYQHDWLTNGEPQIDRLIGDPNNDDFMKMALRKGMDQGVKTPDEWKQWNSKQAKSRQKNSYQDYVVGLCKKQMDGFRKRSKNQKLSERARSETAKDLAFAKRNQGIPLGGGLLYLSNADDYHNLQTSEDLAKYRNFESDTLKTFVKSDTFKKLVPGCFVAELHRDEIGSMHVQFGTVGFHKDKLGRVVYSLRTTNREALKSFYGDDRYEKLLDTLCELHHTTPSYSGNEKIGKTRIDAMLWHRDRNGDLTTKHYSAQEHKARIDELWRFTLIHELGNLAMIKSKQHHVDYTIPTTYQTDGDHKSRDEYVADHEAKSRVKRVQKQSQTEITKHDRDLKLANQAHNELVSLYKQLPNHQPKAPEDPRTLYKHVHRHLTDLDDQKQKLQNEVQQLQRQQQQQLLQDRQRLRTLIVNVMVSMLRDLGQLAIAYFKRRKTVRTDLERKTLHQQLRNTLTVQVDRQLQSQLPQHQNQTPQRQTSHDDQAEL